MVKEFNVTFNNISGISWWSVLLMEETVSSLRSTWRKPPAADKLYHIMWYRVHLTMSDHDHDGPQFIQVVTYTIHIPKSTLEFGTYRCVYFNF